MDFWKTKCQKCEDTERRYQELKKKLLESSDIIEILTDAVFKHDTKLEKAEELSNLRSLLAVTKCTDSGPKQP